MQCTQQPEVRHQHCFSVKLCEENFSIASHVELVLTCEENSMQSFV
jgi:hypothetical protein